jgi:hypothetical protein
MKNLKLVIVRQLCVVAMMGVALVGQAQSQSFPSAFDVQQISSTAWNTRDGIVNTQVPGANLGATSFEVVGSNRIAFLCNSTSEIVIVNSADGMVIQHFPVAFAPRDFVYDKGEFYVLSQLQVDVYDENGKAVNSFAFPQTYAGVERMARCDGSTWLLLPSGNSAIIETSGQMFEPKEFEGWITSSGNRVATKLVGEDTYTITLFTESGGKSESTFETDKKVAGVNVVGVTKDRIYLDVQTFLSENPIRVERKIVSIEIENLSINKIVSEIKIPDVYYVLSNKDFAVSAESKLYTMITDEEGIFFFSLSEIETGKGTSRPFPYFLTNKAYHFNDHLMKIETE